MFFVNIFKFPIATTHDFRNLEKEVDYFVDFAESGKSATLTTAWGIRRGDKIILSYQKEAVMYEVEDLDYYCNDDSIKTMLLRKIGKVPDNKIISGINRQSS